MKLKRFKDIINEGKIDDPNYISPVSKYDSDRQWFVVDVEEGEIISAWDNIYDSFIDGLWSAIGYELEGVEDEFDFVEIVDGFLSKFGYEFEEDEEPDTIEIDDFIKAGLGIEEFVIRHRSEL